jgi:hypothetical protein
MSCAMNSHFYGNFYVPIVVKEFSTFECIIEENEIVFVLNKLYDIRWR